MIAWLGYSSLFCVIFPIVNFSKIYNKREWSIEGYFFASFSVIQLISLIRHIRSILNDPNFIHSSELPIIQIEQLDSQRIIDFKNVD